MGGIGWLAGCSRPAKDTQIKAILGGVAINPSGETFSDAVILVAGSHFHTVGSEMNVRVPPGSMSWSAKDRYVVPAPVERRAGVLLPRIDTLAAAQAAILRPPLAVERIPADADHLPLDLLTRFARADTIVVPRLAWLLNSPLLLDRGIRHVRALHGSGVRIASFGDRNSLTEWRLLTAAGLTPAQVLESATRHAARAARVEDAAGSLHAGYLANLWILKNDPLASTDHLNSVDGIMLEGVWQQNAGVSA
jgi:hypothetical protein